MAPEIFKKEGIYTNFQDERLFVFALHSLKGYLDYLYDYIHQEMSIPYVSQFDLNKLFGNLRVSKDTSQKRFLILEAHIDSYPAEIQSFKILKESSLVEYLSHYNIDFVFSKESDLPENFIPPRESMSLDEIKNTLGGYYK